jgi:hypothetical protein
MRRRHSGWTGLEVQLLLPAAEGSAATGSALGIAATTFLLPEPRGKSLEEIADQALTPAEKAQPEASPLRWRYLARG